MHGETHSAGPPSTDAQRDGGDESRVGRAIEPHDGACGASKSEQFADLLIAYQAALVAGVDPPPAAFEAGAADGEMAVMLPRAAACLRLLEQVRLAALAPVGGTDRHEPATLRGATTGQHIELAEEWGRADGSSPLAGLSIGRFQVIRELGSGGHGIVVLARDPVLHRDVALKIPRPNHSSRRRAAALRSRSRDRGPARTPEHRARVRSGRARSGVVHRVGVL